MDTKDIRGFMRSFELGSINKAAADLFITPQGLGKEISRLESEVGAQLFMRTPAGLVPTEAGLFLYKKSIDLMNRIQDITQGIRRLQEEGSSLTIGCSCGVVNVIDILCLDQLSGEDPETSVSWDEDINVNIKEGILSGKYDAAVIIGRMASADICHLPLLHKTYSAVVCAKHPFYDRQTLSMEDLKDEPLIIMNERYQSYYNIIQRCEDFGFLPNIRFKTMESSVIYRLAADGLGMGLDVDIHDRRMYQQSVRLIPVTDSMPWSVQLVCREARRQEPLIRKLFGLAEKGLLLKRQNEEEKEERT